MMNRFSLAFLLAVLTSIDGVITTSSTSFEPTSPSSKIDTIPDTSLGSTTPVLPFKTTITDSTTITEILSTIASTDQVTVNTTPIVTNPTSTIQTTSLVSTDVTTTDITTSLDTTQVTTSPTITLLDTTQVTTTPTTTPLDTTQVTTAPTTTPLDTTQVTTSPTTTPLDTTQVTTTPTTTTLDTTQVTTAPTTTPLDTTQVTTAPTTTSLDTTQVTTAPTTTPTTQVTTAPTTMPTTQVTTAPTTTTLDTTQVTTAPTTTSLDTTQVTTAPTSTSLDTTQVTTAPTTMPTTQVTTAPTTTSLDTTQVTTAPTTTPLDTTQMTPTTTPLKTTTPLRTTIPTTRLTTKREIKWTNLTMLLRIMRPWSPELNKKNSSKYSALTKEIKNSVNSILSGKVSDFKILNYKPANVIAEIYFRSSETEPFSKMEAAIKTGKVGTLKVDPSFPLKILTSVNVSTNRKSYTMVEGDRLSVECMTSPSPFFANIKILWMFNDLLILETKNSADRIQVKQGKNSNNQTIGTLTFKTLRLRDTSTLQCFVTGNIKSNSEMISLQVKPLPQLKLTADNRNIESGTNATLRCSVVNKVPVLKISFHLIKGVIGRNSTNNNETLILSNVKNKTTIACRAISQYGNVSAEVELIITLDVYPARARTCPKNKVWPITPIGTIAEIPCESGFTGNIQRFCQTDGKWENPNSQFCVQKTFGDIKETLVDIQDNIGGNTTLVLDKLDDITNQETAKNLTAGEMIATIAALDIVVDITDKQIEIEESQIDSFLSVADNIITPTRGDKWSAIKKKNKRLGFDLLKKMENFGSIVAIKSTNATKTTISKENLALVASQVSLEEKNSFPGDVKTLDSWVKEAKTTMELSSNLLKEIAGQTGTNKLPVSVVLFKDISSILTDSNEEELNETDEAKPTLNTMVLSITVGDKNSISLQNPIELGFKHLNKSENLKALCSYWEFDKTATTGVGWSQKGCEVASSNSSETRCKCYHLTNFAVLTSIYDVEVNKALSLITIIGCSISIACCVLTIILYICFWKQMAKTKLGKSKSVLLINMCVAIILTYTLFLAGIEAAREHKIACTIVAALLHFFCLSLFFSLLMYAADMAITIFSVFAMTFNRLPLMLCLTWLFPAIIVAVTLGITKTEGYGNTNFCWLSIEGGIIWAFLGPVIFIILINTILLIYLFRTSMSSTTIKNKSERDKIKSGAQALCLTTPIFGITWVIGLFLVNRNTEVLQYLFTIINSLQGLLIFLAFCVFNKQFRQAVTNKYERITDLRSTDRSILTKSKRTQISNVRERSRDSTHDNPAFSQQEEPTPDYLDLEFMFHPESQSVDMNNYASLPVRDHPRNRRYLDGSAQLPSINPYLETKYSKKRGNWDNEMF